MKKYLILENPPTGLDLIACISLQGLVNRSGPRLYINKLNETDGHWIEWYRKYGLQGKTASWETILDTFIDDVDGAYIVGRQKPDIEIPLAVTMAGINNRMLVTAGQAKALKKFGKPIEPLPVPDFATRLDAGTWALGNLRPQTNPTLLHSFPPIDQFGGLGVQDFIIAQKGYSFALTSNPVTRPGERQLLSMLYEKAPAFTRLLGWVNPDDMECSYVDLASRYAIVPFCVMSSLNFSFHFHVKANRPFKQKQVPKVKSPLKGQACLTFVLSDGDALHSMVDLQKKQWPKKCRGEFPFGWTIQPQLLYFAPAVLEYFFATATPNDEIMLGPSGLGYNYLSCFGSLRKEKSPNKKGWRDEFLKRTCIYVKKLGLTSGWPINRIVEWIQDGSGRMMRRINGNNTWMVVGDIADVFRYGIDFIDDALVDDYFAALPECVGFFQGWYNSPGEKERIRGKQAWFPQKVIGEKVEQTIADIEKLAHREGPSCFIPVHVNCYSMGIDGIKKVIEKLDPARFTILRPSDFLKSAVAMNTKMGK